MAPTHFGNFLALTVTIFSTIPSIIAQNTNLGAAQYAGCYSASGSLSNTDTYLYQSSGYCQQQCGGQNQAVMGLSGGNVCWCGNDLPPPNTKVDDTTCNSPCSGYAQDNCGGNNAWSVYLTGANKGAAPSIGGGSPSPSGGKSAPTSTAQTIVTLPGQTVTATLPGQAPSTSSPTGKGKSSSSTVGIAVGVVVGVAAIAGIVLGVFFYLRHRRRRDAEKHYQRNAAISGFIREGGKPPDTAHSDSRLDPNIQERRHSDGSIADNEDFSRRILKVTNPDGH